MRQKYKNTVILSAELSTLSDKENERRTNILDGMLSDMGFAYEKVEGQYKGTKETSFLCIVRSKYERQVLFGYAFDTFGQESVLLQDTEGKAFFCDGFSAVKAGKIKKVSEAKALKADGYTKKSDGTFWIVTN